MSQLELADEAGMHRNTVVGIELYRHSEFESLLRCQLVLEAHGVEFVEAGGRSGVVMPNSMTSPGAAALRGARAALLLDRAGFVALAGISRTTTSRIEDGDVVRQSYIEMYLSTLARLGIDVVTIEDGVAMMLPPATQLAEYFAGRDLK